jgi:hypothetical protein
VTNQQEEMLTTNVQVQFIQRTIPSLPEIAGNVVAWIYEFCDSQWLQPQKRCGSCKRWKGGKRILSNKKDKQEQTVSKDKEKKRGRKSKMLPTLSAQEVDIPLVVGGASCSPLTRPGINANDSSIGPSIGMSSYDDATLGDNTVSRDPHDELIQMHNENDANAIGDGGTSDAEGEGYKCVVSFKDGMKEVELKHLCSDANEIESGVEVDNNDGFVCEVKDESVQSMLYGAPPGWSPPCGPDDWNPTINRNKGDPLLKDVDHPEGWSLCTFRPMLLNQEVENTSVMPCRLALFLFLLML